VVSSYAIDNGDQLLLFDPLAVPREIVELAADRQPAIVLTCPWHERDTRSLAERLSAPVFVPPPDEGSPDVAWLLAGDAVERHLFSAGDRLPVGVEAFPGREPNDVVLWVESRRAVIAGDTLVDFGQGVEIPPEWLPDGMTPKQVTEGCSSGRCARHARWASRSGRPRARALLSRSGLSLLRSRRPPSRLSSCLRPASPCATSVRARL
jgi:glyoxylase-like metal-dependent hydrolase (beta-lactamase superfamily II)